MIAAMIRYNRPFEYSNPIVRKIQAEYEAFNQTKQTLEFQMQIAMLGDNQEAKKEMIQAYLDYLQGDVEKPAEAVSTIPNEQIQADIEMLRSQS